MVKFQNQVLSKARFVPVNLGIGLDAATLSLITIKLLARLLLEFWLMPNNIFPDSAQARFRD